MPNQSTLILADLFPEELSEAEQANRQARKEYLLEQGRLLSEAYDAGRLREMLARLRVREQSVLEALEPHVL